MAEYIHHSVIPVELIDDLKAFPIHVRQSLITTMYDRYNVVIDPETFDGVSSVTVFLAEENSEHISEEYRLGPDARLLTITWEWQNPEKEDGQNNEREATDQEVGTQDESAG